MPEAYVLPSDMLTDNKDEELCASGVDLFREVASHLTCALSRLHCPFHPASTISVFCCALVRSASSGFSSPWLLDCVATQITLHTGQRRAMPPRKSAARGDKAKATTREEVATTQAAPSSTQAPAAEVCCTMHAGMDHLHKEPACDRRRSGCLPRSTCSQSSIARVLTQHTTTEARPCLMRRRRLK